MKGRLDRKKIIYGAVSALCFAILWAATFRSGATREPRLGVEMVVFGDSVSTDLGELMPVPERLSERLGISVYNASMGGTCAARLESERRLDDAGGSLSLASLTKAVYAGDFSVQQSARLRKSNQETFPEIIDGLASIDFGQVDTVLIQRGVNDYHAGIRMEDPGNLYDEYTFLGALRSAVRDLRVANPEIRILIITPTYTWYRYADSTCEEMDYGGGLLEGYVDAQLRLGQELGVEVVDLYHDFYPHENWEDWERYTLDGLHPNDAGREKIVEKIVEVLEKGQE